jgi:hypothetical protein
LLSLLLWGRGWSERLIRDRSKWSRGVCWQAGRLWRGLGLLWVRWESKIISDVNPRCSHQNKTEKRLRESNNAIKWKINQKNCQAMPWIRIVNKKREKKMKTM